MSYDYDLENYKVCPVCGKIIDYHYDGFYHDTVLNIWVCRDHPLKEIEKTVKLKDTDLIKFIQDGEADFVCPVCAGREPVTDLESGLMFEVKPCISCGSFTSPEEGALRV